MHPLVDEAMKKAAVAWLTVPAPDPATADRPALAPTGLRARLNRRTTSGQPATSDQPATAGQPGTAGRPVWCLWIDGALCVVSGPGEQPAPGLAEATTALVSIRGDHGGRILSWPAVVSRVTPEDPDWATVAGQLAAKRLNASGTTAETVDRWAAGCVLSRLTPAGEPTEAGPSLDPASGAAPPLPTPAARRTAKPFRLHRVRRPR
jgi:hypothetical protein